MTILLVKLCYMLKKADRRERLQFAGCRGAMQQRFLSNLQINFWRSCLQ